MEKLNQLEIEWNKPLTNEQLEKIIYNIFCAIIFILPIIPERIGMGIYSLKNTMFNIVVITTTISLGIINRKKFKLNVYDVLSIIYLVFVTLSCLFTKYGILECILGKNGRGEGVITIFSYIASFTICTRGYKYIIKNYKLGIIAAAIVSVYGIIQANVSLDVKLPFGVVDVLGVAEGTMGNQNFFSSYLCIFLPMTCYYFLNTKEYKSILAIAILFTALVFSKTLGGYLVFVAIYLTICLLSFIYSTHRKAVFIKIIIMTLVILSIFVLITNKKSDSYIEEVASVKEEVVNLANKSEKFGTSRLAIWKRVIMAIDNSKLTGVGPDSLKKEFMDKQYHIDGDDDMLSRIIVDKAHSEYLHIAVTTGIPSLVIYMIIILTICIRLANIIFKMHKHDYENKNKLYITMTGVAIVSYLAQAVGNISVVQVAPIFWCILGIGAGITLNEKVNLKQ